VLPALREYQFSIEAPAPPPDSFDIDAAVRGRALFECKAGCVTCHNGVALTDAPTLHPPDVVGTSTDEARRSVTGMYRTTPLRGVWQHPPYFHDGSAATLLDVVKHYDAFFALDLSEAEQMDLEQFLRSL
jgi:cytochrome c peroxidase